ncbi:MAG: dimethyl sulfoxide reductase anchor subunit family protein [Alphaproteobacteria bacterium]
MHPAFSVIFFTTASGAGYGLLFLMGLLSLAGLLPPDRMFGLAGFAVALGLVTAGLLSSTFHLGHPERAWRALSQWRSSWLSREGVASILTYLPVLAFAFGWVFRGETGGIWALLGLVSAAACVATVYCTAMIYGSLRTIHAWSNRLVPPGYLLLGLFSGALLLNMLAHLFGAAHPVLDWITILSAIAAWFAKAAYWRFIDDRPGISTAESATGLKGPVRLLESPHTQDNYLLREMGYRVARKHAAKLRIVAAVAGFLLPMLLTLLAFFAGNGTAGWLSVPAALLGLLGILVERWLFFAEAKHAVTLYYGAAAA